MKNSRKKRRDAIRHSKIKWEDVYELPLHLDKYGCYAFSKNDTMALSFEFPDSEEAYTKGVEQWKDWVACINLSSNSPVDMIAIMVDHVQIRIMIASIAQDNLVVAQYQQTEQI